MTRNFLLPVSVILLLTEYIAAHAGHASHSSTPGILSLAGIIAGVAISATGLYLSVKKYTVLSEEDPS